MGARRSPNTDTFYAVNMQDLPIMQNSKFRFQKLNFNFNSSNCFMKKWKSVKQMDKHGQESRPS